MVTSHNYANQFQNETWLLACLCHFTVPTRGVDATRKLALVGKGSQRPGGSFL